MAAASILLSLAAGVLLVYRFGGLATLRPRWAALMLTVGSGIAAGIALTSILYFILLPLGMPRASLFVRIAIVIATAYECWRSRRPLPPREPAPRFAYEPLLWIAFLFVTSKRRFLGLDFGRESSLCRARRRKAHEATRDSQALRTEHRRAGGERRGASGRADDLPQRDDVIVGGDVVELPVELRPGETVVIRDLRPRP